MAYDKVVDSTQLDGALTATADAIRGKTGSSASIPWDMSAGFSAAIAAIPTGGGGSDAEDAIITRTISGTYSNSRVTNIGSYAFGYCSFLTSVEFPNVWHVGSYAFIRCSLLKYVNLPLGSQFDSGAFAYCSDVSSLSLPAAHNISGYAFSSCTRLVSLYLMGSSFCELTASTIFSRTPIGGYSAIAGRYGSIYVPASMLDSYKTRAFWSFFSNRFVGI